MPSKKLPVLAQLGFYFRSNRKSRFLFVISSSILFTLIVYLLVVPLLGIFNAEYIISILVYRGFIPYIIIFFFGVMMSILMLNIFKTQFEYFAYYFTSTELDLQETMVYNDSQSILKKLSDEKYIQIQESLVIKRLKRGMQRLFNTQDTNALTEYFKLRSEIEYAEMDTDFSTVKYLNWLIPTLGFIGTVLGIGVGISGFASIIQNAEHFNQIKEFLPTVTSSLGVAFDTTFLALILSVIGMFTTSFVVRRHSTLLENIDSYCLDEISSRFKLHSNAAEEMKDVFRVLRDDIENLLNSNRIEMGNRLDAIVIHLNNFNKYFVGQAIKSQDLSGIVLLIKQLIKNTERKEIGDETAFLNRIVNELEKCNQNIANLNIKPYSSRTKTSDKKD